MAPNPIDFDQVFTELPRLSETGNVAVIIAVSGLFGLYLVLLLWVRKADKRDLLKVSDFFLLFYHIIRSHNAICTRYAILNRWQLTANS